MTEQLHSVLICVISIAMSPLVSIFPLESSSVLIAFDDARSKIYFHLFYNYSFFRDHLLIKVSLTGTCNVKQYSRIGTIERSGIRFILLSLLPQPPRIRRKMRRIHSHSILIPNQQVSFILFIKSSIAFFERSVNDVRSRFKLWIKATTAGTSAA